MWPSLGPWPDSKSVWIHAAAWSCGYPADFSDLAAAGAAGAVTSAPSSHLRRPDRCSLLTPCLVQPATLTTQNVACKCHHSTRGQERLRGYLTLPPHLHPIGAGRIAARCSRPARSLPATLTSQVCCLRPIFPSVTHQAAGSGRPQCHSMRCRLSRCAASNPSSLPSLTGPRGRAAHSVTARGVDCTGVLPPARLPFRQSPGRWVGPPTSVKPAGA